LRLSSIKHVLNIRACIFWNIGGQQLQAQQGIYNLQNQLGQQQQAQQQRSIDQAVLDYANAQNYPMEQLSDMSSLVRGTPMTNSTTTQYAAAPSTTSQLLGTATTLGGAYLAGSKKEGGVIRDKGYATGGIVAFNIGGAIEAKFQDMTLEQIEKTLSEATSEQEKKIGNRVLAEKRMARGGIVGYKKEGEVKEDPELKTTGIEYSANQKRLKEERKEKKAEEEEAAKLKQLEENNEWKSVAEQNRAKLEALEAEREAEQRSKELQAATSEVFSAFPTEVRELAEEMGVGLSEATDEAKEALKLKLEKVQAKVATEKKVTPNNPSNPTSATAPQAELIERMKYGDKQARSQVIADLPGVKQMRKMAGFEE